MDHQLAEKECTALAALFQQIITDMKNSTPVWEEFTTKAARLQIALRSTVLATASFLEAFQKVADMATNTRGATRDIGSALTRLCMRHRSIEHKMKTMTGSILDVLVAPLQDKMEDWKKIASQLDKDHGKESKKAQQDVRKAVSDTTRLQKKVKKGRSDVQGQLDLSLNDLRHKIQILQEVERNAVRAALTEERARYCLFISAIKPFMDSEISMLGDVTHLQEIMDSLCNQAAEPHLLPAASEQVVADISGCNPNWTSPTPPRSPALSMTSSKSSLSSMSSSCSSQSPIHRKANNSENSASDSDSLMSTCQEVLAVTTSTAPAPSTTVLTTPSAASTPVASSVVPIQELCRGMSWSPTSGAPNVVHRHHMLSDPLTRLPLGIDSSRPHTISSAYERLHMRTALTDRTFEPPASSAVMSHHQQVQLPSYHHLHHHHHHHPHQVPCCGGGGPSLVGGPYAAMTLQHRSMAVVAPKPRPYTISRDVLPDDVLYQTPTTSTSRMMNQMASTSSGLVASTTSNEGSQTPIEMQGTAVSEANDAEGTLNDKVQVTSSEYRSRVKSFSENQPTSTCTETVKSLTEAIRRLEENARDGDFDIPSSSQRSLQHSVSCGTILVDHRTVSGPDSSSIGKSNDDALRSIARRSSMYIPGRPTSPVRRAMSMVVPMLAKDYSTLPRYGGCDDSKTMTSLGHRMTQSDIVVRRSSEFDRMPSSPFVGFGGDEQLEDDEHGCYFDNGILLPPSPFRSLDFAVDANAKDTNGHAIDSQLPFVAATRNSGTNNQRPYPMQVGGDQQRSVASDNGRDRLLWMPMSSPDDVTPTNENQPQGFGQRPPKSPAPPLTGGLYSPPAKMADIQDSYQLRYSQL